jgi:hypothetical protein
MPKIHLLPERSGKLKENIGLVLNSLSVEILNTLKSGWNQEA